MPLEILMPALSPTMTEGKITRWLKQEGETVKAGQVLAEIETDKATMEVEAVDEGRLLKILVPGETQGVKVNAVIAVLAEEGEEKLTVEEALALLAKKKGGSKALAALSPVAAQTGDTTTEKNMASSSAALRDASGGRLLVSPLARRLAAQKGIDLRSVAGSGPHGRIVQEDVRKAGLSGAVVPASRGVSPASGQDVRSYADKLGMAYDVIPNSGVRKVIARRLAESKQTVPHFYLTIDCEIDALLALRSSVIEASGVKVSVNDCVIRAVALALKKVPAANVSWTDDAILHYKQCDVSVAVATANGLITPIIKQADTKTLAQIAAEMKELAAKARENKLRPEEFQGGGFTISNLGMFGIKEFSAIINPPQSCILAVGAGEPRPVVKNGQLAVATVMSCTLSTDHRSVDGAVGAEFLAAFKKLIEQPFGLVV